VTPKGFDGGYNIINHSLIMRYDQYNKNNDKTHENELSKFENKIIIEQNENGSFTLNEVLIEGDEEVIKVVKKEIKENSGNYIIMLYLDSNASFSSYINIISLLRGVIVGVRNMYSLNKYGANFDFLNRRQKREVYDKYPVRVYELFK
jgi:biopolymer transport protein ExbD